MASLLIYHANILAPQALPDASWVLAIDGKIDRIGSKNEPLPPAEKKINAENGYLVPGFIDIHVHGAMGFETMDADPDGLVEMAKYYAKHGVTAFLPTTWAAPMKRILRVFDAIQQAMQLDYKGAKILGAHLEGPFICAHKAGAQNPESIFPATPEIAQSIINQKIVKIITMAPEIPENLAVIPAFTEAGIAVSAGHTQATYEDMVIAVERGVKSVTHTFNAMVGIHHRNPGTAGAALTIDELYTEVIADNIHVHPAILKLIVNAKPEDRLLLITDAIRGTGLSDGIYPIDDRNIIIENGIARLESGNLAGSTLTLDKALKNMVAAAGKPLERILPAVTSNPATLSGVADRKGAIRPGLDADFVVLSPAMDIQHTVIQGNLVE